MRIAKFALLLVLVAALAMVIATTTGRTPRHPLAGEFPDEWFMPVVSEAEVAAQAKLVGKPMPPLFLSDWQNGEVAAEQMAGKVVVLDFWATWCLPCIAAIPANNALYATYKPKSMEMVGICTDIGQENYGRILARHQPQYPMARDAEVKTAMGWSILTLPTYAVVDRKGIVRAVGLKHEHIEDVVKKLLAE